jgi:hypothetical protein
VVVRELPFHRTVELEMKLAPVSVNVKADPPAVAVLGEIPVRVGMGLGGGGGGAAEIVNVCAPDVPPPGARLKTVIAAVPEETMSPARVAAVSVVLLR